MRRGVRAAQTPARKGGSGLGEQANFGGWRGGGVKRSGPEAGACGGVGPRQFQNGPSPQQERKPNGSHRQRAGRGWWWNCVKVDAVEAEFIAGKQTTSPWRT
jgi:hypothetical protein